MGVAPSHEADDVLFSYFRGTYEIGLIPITRRYFNSEKHAMLRARYVDMRNSPSVRFYLRSSSAMCKGRASRHSDARHDKAEEGQPLSCLLTPEAITSTMKSGVTVATNSPSSQSTGEGSSSRCFASVAPVPDKDQDLGASGTVHHEGPPTEPLTSSPSATQEYSPVSIASVETQNSIPAQPPCASNQADREPLPTDSVMAVLERAVCSTAPSNADGAESPMEPNPDEEDPATAMSDMPPAWYTQESLDRLLDSIENNMYKTNADMLNESEHGKPLWPVPCAVCLVYHDGKARPGCFEFFGRVVNIVGHFGITNEPVDEEANATCSGSRVSRRCGTPQTSPSPPEARRPPGSPAVPPTMLDADQLQGQPTTGQESKPVDFPRQAAADAGEDTESHGSSSRRCPDSAMATLTEHVDLCFNVEDDLQSEQDMEGAGMLTEPDLYLVGDLSSDPAQESREATAAAALDSGSEKTDPASPKDPPQAMSDVDDGLDVHILSAFTTSAGDRTLERVLLLACVMLRARFCELATSTLPIGSEYQQHPGRLLIRRLSQQYYNIMIWKNNFAALKCITETLAFIASQINLQLDDYTFGKDAIIKEGPPDWNYHLRLSPDCTGRIIDWISSLLRNPMVIPDSKWVQYKLKREDERLNTLFLCKEKIVSMWKSSSAMAPCYLGGAEETLAVYAHLEGLSQDRALARANPDLKRAGHFEDSGGNRYVLYNGKHGPFLVYIKDVTEKDERKNTKQTTARSAQSPSQHQGQSGDGGAQKKLKQGSHSPALSSPQYHPHPHPIHHLQHHQQQFLRQDLQQHLPSMAAAGSLRMYADPLACQLSHMPSATFSDFSSAGQNALVSVVMPSLQAPQGAASPSQPMLFNNPALHQSMPSTLMLHQSAQRQQPHPQGFQSVMPPFSTVPMSVPVNNMFSPPGVHPSASPVSSKCTPPSAPATPTTLVSQMGNLPDTKYSTSPLHSFSAVPSPVTDTSLAPCDVTTLVSGGSSQAMSASMNKSAMGTPASPSSFTPVPSGAVAYAPNSRGMVYYVAQQQPQQPGAAAQTQGSVGGLPMQVLVPYPQIASVHQLSQASQLQQQQQQQQQLLLQQQQLQQQQQQQQRLVQAQLLSPQIQQILLQNQLAQSIQALSAQQQQQQQLQQAQTLAFSQSVPYGMLQPFLAGGVQSASHNGDNGSLAMNAALANQLAAAGLATQSAPASHRLTTGYPYTQLPVNPTQSQQPMSFSWT